MEALKSSQIVASFFSFLLHSINLRNHLSNFMIVLFNLILPLGSLKMFALFLNNRHWLPTLLDYQTKFCFLF